MSSSSSNDESLENSSPPSPTSTTEPTTTINDEAIGVCADGTRFRVPETYDCIENLFNPKKWLEIPVMIQLGLIVFYIFLLTYTNTPRWVCIMCCVTQQQQLIILVLYD
jgi:hypothetical protein